jgi:hypothetical protein
VARGHLKVGDECPRAVALILVLPAFDQTRFQRPCWVHTLKRLQAGFFIAAPRMNPLFMADRGLARGLADLRDLGSKRRRILSALMVEPVPRAVRFESGFLSKSAPRCGARWFPQCRA